MLSKRKIRELKDLLRNSQRPLFFYDNDPDGLISFVLLRRWLGRGAGVPIKGISLDERLARHVRQANADYVFILDKPTVTKDFVRKAREVAPVAWIDHHVPSVNEKVSKLISHRNVLTFNPLLEKKPENTPVSYVAWQITRRDDWLAALGCLADWYLPAFLAQVRKKFPDLLPKKAEGGEKVDDILYETDFGKIDRILYFAMLNRPSEIKKLANLLVKADSPYGILKGEAGFDAVLRFASKLEKIFWRLLEKAKRKGVIKGRLLYFSYRAKISMIGELANYLLHIHPSRLVVLTCRRDGRTNVSVRDRKEKSCLRLLRKTLLPIEGSQGGGHEEAAGGVLPTSKLSEFERCLGVC